MIRRNALVKLRAKLNMCESSSCRCSYRWVRQRHAGVYSYGSQCPKRILHYTKITFLVEKHLVGNVWAIFKVCGLLVALSITDASNPVRSDYVQRVKQKSSSLPWHKNRENTRSNFENIGGNAMANQCVNLNVRGWTTYIVWNAFSK